MPSNKAAYQPAKNAPLLEVRDAPYTSPTAKQVVIRNAAVAVNPVDWMIQQLGQLLYTWLKYPFVLGIDLAGEVVEVGSGVTRFKVGDRVLGNAIGADEHYNSSAQGAFQKYTVLLEHMTSPIPASMSYESASVIPLGASTAACGLFQKDQLALQYPTAPAQKPTGKTLLVWGGSTSVGCNTIQLAVAAGYEVFTTSSPRNFELVKKLGASQVFDYNSNTVVADIINAFKGKTTAGAFSIGPSGADACIDILHKCKGDKFIALATYPNPSPLPKRFVMPQMAWSFVSWNAAHFVKSKTRGIRSKFIFGSTLVDNGVGKMLYEDFLPKALEQGTFMPAPEPEVVGKGLESVQHALDVQKKGVSAKKVVVAL
ncbi:hypothetical protein MMC21_005951 [Puttea exsequens]|nr:hypothetical protein [Puttea exsequens]